MKKALFTLAAVAFMGWSQSSFAADSWAFDGSDQQVEQMAKKAEAMENAKNMYAEVYQNKALCWSWDACADKPRVYGKVYDSYSFE